MKARYVTSAAFIILSAAAAMLFGPPGTEPVALTPRMAAKQVWNTGGYPASFSAPPSTASVVDFPAPSPFSESAPTIAPVPKSPSATTTSPINYADLGILPAI